jgi:hypothetical protein
MSCSVMSCSKWTLNGTKRMRLQIPSSVPAISGLCWVESHSFSCGLNSKGSLNLKQALMVSPPVSCLVVWTYFQIEAVLWDIQRLPTS